MSREAMKQALEALETGWPVVADLFRVDHVLRYEAAITALRQALANEALDRMAENARELGLDYDPAGGTQVSKVWWDGDKLMAKPIPLSEVYKEPEQQPSEGGDCDSPSWCKQYGKCHRKVVGVPTLANCMDEQQPADEPVAWVRQHELPLVPGDAFSWVETAVHKTPLYTRPRSSVWVGLTDEEQNFIYQQMKLSVAGEPFWVRFAHAIEQSLKEKNQ